MNDEVHTSPKIAPADFSPPPSGGKTPWRFRPAWVGAGLAVLVIAWFLFFLVTAVSLRISSGPTLADIEIDGGFHLRIGDSYLLRPGEYQLNASADGYYPFEGSYSVMQSRNIELNLQPLPGSLMISVEPPEIEELDVQIGSRMIRGENPLHIEDLEPGNYRLNIDASLYSSEAVEVSVQGLGTVQELNLSLEPAWAEVFVQSVPSEAQIVDQSGRLLGETPTRIRLEEGQVLVHLRKPRYQDAELDLQIVRDQALNAPTVQLLPLESQLNLTSAPTGAAVVIDGEYRGETPLQLDLLPDRDYQLRLFKAGYGAHESRVRLNQGENLEVNQELSQVTGQLAINVSPEDAQIWIDGRQVANGSTELTLSAVNHRIEVRKEGYRTQTREFLPLQNQQQVISFSLLTDSEAIWADIPQNYQYAGHQFRLFRDAGSVQLGSSRREADRRANEVEWSAELQRAFYAATHEVTNNQYRRFDPEHSSGNFARMSLDGSDQPVVGITWQEAALYCNWLSEQEGLAPFYQTQSGYVSGINSESTGYRLLTEAEWTWLAKVTSSQLVRIYPWGNEPEPRPVDNFAGAEIGANLNFTLGIRDGFPVSAPVGSFPPNDKGMYDLGGNVAEYLHDWYAAEAPASEALTDPLGPSQGEYHVIRGASWSRGYLPQLRLAYRDYDAVGRNDVGFRVGRYAR